MLRANIPLESAMFISPPPRSSNWTAAVHNRSRHVVVFFESLRLCKGHLFLVPFFSDCLQWLTKEPLCRKRPGKLRGAVQKRILGYRGMAILSQMREQNRANTFQKKTQLRLRKYSKIQKLPEYSLASACYSDHGRSCHHGSIP